MKRYLQRRRTSGFTLVETMFSMVIMMLVGLSVVAGVVYTRQSMELNKQQISALNYCRQAMELAETYTQYQGRTVDLVQFNDPGTTITATVSVNFYEINSSGVADWSAPMALPTENVPPNDRPVACVVSCTWQPAGSWSRMYGRSFKTVSMKSIIRKGL